MKRSVVLGAVVATIGAVLVPVQPSEAGVGHPTIRFYPDTESGSVTWVYGRGGDQHLMCDWDGDGVDTFGLYRPSAARWYLRNEAGGGDADTVFQYGRPGVGDLILCGDWDGDGTDTVGVFRTSTNKWYLRNSNDGGYADLTFQYGRPGVGDIPVVGDWDGDGRATVGVFRTSTNRWYLRDSNDGGHANREFRYGDPARSDVPVVGDWNGDGTETVGVYRRSTETFLLRDANGAGSADHTRRIGPSYSTPITGDSDGDGRSGFGIVEQPGDVPLEVSGPRPPPRPNRRIFAVIDERVVSMRPDGSDVRPADPRIDWLSIDPAGQFLAYSHRDSGTVRRMALDGTDDRHLAHPASPGSTSVRAGLVAPDGSQVLLSEFNGGSGFITSVVRSDGSRQVLVFDNRIQVSEWSPDGRSLLVTVSGDPELYRYDIATGTRTPVGSQAARFSRGFEYSPDGSTIYLLRDEQIWAMAAEGGEPRQLTDGAEIHGYLVEPTGTLLVIWAFRDGRTGIHRYSATGRYLHPVHTSGTFYSGLTT